MIDKDTNILIISTSCLEVPPDNYGGVEAMVYNLAHELGDRGYNTTCAAPEGTEIENVEIIETVPAEDTTDCFMKEPDAYYEYADRLHEFDIVIDHSWQKITYLHWRDNDISTDDIPILGVWHGMPSVSQKPPVESPRFLSVSKAASKAWGQHTGLEVRHAYNGVDFDKYKLRDDNYINSDYILTVNRIMPEKGIKECIEVAHEAGVNIVVAGEDQFVDDPGYVHEVMAMCANSKYATYLGTVSHEKKVDLMRGAMATILFPTRGYQEVFGLAAVESMACGTPVVCPPNNGLSEVVDTVQVTGVCETTDEMVDFISTIDNGYAETRLPVHIRTNAENYFSKEAMTDLYLERMEESLEEHW